MGISAFWKAVAEGLIPNGGKRRVETVDSATEGAARRAGTVSGGEKRAIIPNRSLAARTTK
ncbi:hypothetical protein GsuE55_00640 [Geobacillus subterraneus]|uniref:Uncharacterized protein n=1 Tax=Geobacillus subterraneus TaxID=129338 RepID=A0A679FU02_9BACL|nr:hypothetical protein B4113_0628 [Geobacillus sp. B4113_201601]BBW95231.1 hypothetical protein GsuE55_00640 [Geobacillus subterraneus]